jgi:hypothetical protein
LPDRQTRKKARARSSTPKITAMAMPAFAPVERLEEGEVEEEAEDAGEEVAVFVSVVELELGFHVIVEADIEVEDEDPTVAVAVPVIELDELAASRSI